MTEKIFRHKNRQERVNDDDVKNGFESRGESVLNGFLDLLRTKGVRISTPEWLQFLQVIEKKVSPKGMEDMLEKKELLQKVRLFAKVSLIKDKSDETIFHETFDIYFGLKDAPDNKEQSEIDDKNEEEEELKDESDDDTVPEIKEQLGIEEVDEDLNLPEGEHNDDEQVHGGKEDQHNDILRKKDPSKIGGGERQEMQEKGYLIGGGKGRSRYAERIEQSKILHTGKEITRKDMQERSKKMGRYDRALKYEVRPDKTSTRQIIKNLRRIITDVSHGKSKNVDVKRTIGNFARRNFRFEYNRERDKQPEIVLLIDVGGPVDEWSPLMKEITEEMADGLSKMEVYLFHNNLYGYVWKPDPKDLLASSYAAPDSLLDLKKIIKKRKKVIIYGDAQMSYSEFESDHWPPDDNEERVKKFGMGGEETLKFIKRKADSVVWINPVFENEWEEQDDSETTKEIGDIIPMYDLTIGGVEDSIRELMKK